MPIHVNNFMGSLGWTLRKRMPRLSSALYLKLQFLTRGGGQRAYTEWFLSQHPAPQPNVVNIETINRCNSTCAFCTEGDDLWSMTDEAFASLGVREMVALGMIGSETEAEDLHVERVRKAYPAYFDTYAEFPKLRAWLDTIPNLYCIGRNGQHRYNNIDHSMCTAFEAVKAILAGSSDRRAVWSVNTEKKYHEQRA